MFSRNLSNNQLNDLNKDESSLFVQSFSSLQSDFSPTFYQVLESQMQQVANLFNRMNTNPNSVEVWHLDRSIENLTDTLEIAKNRIYQGKNSLVMPAGYNSPIRLEQWITGDMRGLSAKTWESFVKLVNDLGNALSELEQTRKEVGRMNPGRCIVS